LSKNNVKTTKISIGIPVYNGELFIQKRLDSVLAQTYENFELIISDNASTDGTRTVCEEYIKKDNRIRYIRQEKNKGAFWNFNYVLQEAKFEYFVWAAVDDVWFPKFLEENIKVLQSNSNYVGSMSKIKQYGVEDTKINSSKINLSFQSFLRNIRYTLKPVDIYPIFGNYEEKIRKFLKKSRLQVLYGVYRTKALKESMVNEEFLGNDHAIMLNILKFGDVNVVNQVLIDFFNAGAAKKGMLSLTRYFKSSKMGTIFPYYPLTSWCLKQLGTKLFFKNIDYFIQLNVWGEFTLLVDIVRLFTLKILRKNPN